MALTKVRDFDVAAGAGIKTDKFDDTGQTNKFVVQGDLDDLDLNTANRHNHPNLGQLDLVTDGDHDVRVDNPHGITPAQISAVPTSEKGAVNGVATLDGSAKIPLIQIPDSILGQVEYQGVWDAFTNTPVLGNGGAGGTTGQYYKVNVAGSTSIDGITDWKIGDWIVHNGITWDKIDNTESVSSVAGKVGAIILVALDITDFTAAVQADVDVAANTAARHGHANKTQIDLVTDGDHDVRLDNPHVVSTGQIGAIPISEKATSFGVATLDGSGFVPDAQISPSIARDSELHAESHTVVSHSDTAATGAQLNTLVGGGDVGTLHLHTGAIVAGLTSHAGVVDAHHAESHTVVSHSDTSATGVQLNTLVGGGDIGALHLHTAEIASWISTHAGLVDVHHTQSHTVVSHSDTTATGAQLNTLIGGADVGALHLHTAAIVSGIASHAGVVDAHHTRYTDTEAAAQVTYNNLVSTGSVGVGAVQVAQGDHTHSEFSFKTMITKSSTYTLLVGEGGSTVLCSGTFILTLPSASGSTGLFYMIKNVSTGTVTVDADVVETIDGELTFDLGEKESITIVGDGTSDWSVF